MCGEELSQTVQRSESQQGLVGGKSKQGLGDEKRMLLGARLFSPFHVYHW